MGGMVNFLNCPPLPRERGCSDVQSLWSVTRKSLRHTTAIIAHDGSNFYITVEGSTVPLRSMRDRLLSGMCEDKHLQTLTASEDQGRVFGAISLDAASSHRIATGKYISFQDYRFGLKARLNLLPTKSVLKRIGKVEIDLCMRCRQAPETLAHILNACPQYAPLMRERHNKILERTVKAIPPPLLVTVSWSRPYLVPHWIYGRTSSASTRANALRQSSISRYLLSGRRRPYRQPETRKRESMVP